MAGQAPYLPLPVMLQQYVDHGGCLFKVYVLGETSGEHRVKNRKDNLFSRDLKNLGRSAAALLECPAPALLRLPLAVPPVVLPSPPCTACAGGGNEAGAVGR